MKLARCPLRPFYEDPEWFNDLVTKANWLEDGKMIEHGGMMDQPAVAIQALEIVTAARAEGQKTRQTREAIRSKLRSGSGLITPGDPNFKT